MLWRRSLTAFKGQEIYFAILTDAKFVPFEVPAQRTYPGWQPLSPVVAQGSNLPDTFGSQEQTKAAMGAADNDKTKSRPASELPFPASAAACMSSSMGTQLILVVLCGIWLSSKNKSHAHALRPSFSTFHLCLCSSCRVLRLLTSSSQPFDWLCLSDIDSSH